MALAKWLGLLPFDGPHEYQKSEYIFSQGDEPGQVFLLASGVVKLVYGSPDGGSVFLGLRYAGDLLGGWWGDPRMNYQFSAITLAPCEIHHLSAARMRTMVHSDHMVAHHHRKALENDLFNVLMNHLALKGLSATERLESLLWDLANHLGTVECSEGTRLILPLNNRDMASLCGLSESHYKKVRSDLEATGRLRRCGRRLWVLPRDRNAIALAAVL